MEEVNKKPLKTAPLSGLVGTLAEDVKAIWKEQFNLGNSGLHDAALNQLKVKLDKFGKYKLTKHSTGPDAASKPKH